MRERLHRLDWHWSACSAWWESVHRGSRSDNPRAMNDLTRSGSKTLAFWPTLIVFYLADFATKRWAEGNLLPVYTPHEVIGDAVRLTLAYNRNAAMGLSLGDYSRVGFTLTAIVVLIVLGVFYRRTPVNA